MFCSSPTIIHEVPSGIRAQFRRGTDASAAVLLYDIRVGQKAFSENWCSESSARNLVLPGKIENTTNSTKNFRL